MNCYVPTFAIPNHPDVISRRNLDDLLATL